MADRVIIVGARRGGKRVSASEIRQMVGRAGRRHGGNACLATIIVEESDIEDVQTEMSNDESLVVSSVMSDPQVLAFHLLPEICAGTVEDNVTAGKWYSRSFGAQQGEEPKFSKAFRALGDCGAICYPGKGARPTPIGVLASRLYFHPGDVKAWKENFDTVFEMGLECDDAAIAWALGAVPFKRMSGDFGSHWQAVNMCRSALPLGLSVPTGTISTITLWLNVFGGPPVGKMKNQAIALRQDFERIRHLLLALDRDVMHWDMEDFFEELGTRAAKGIPSHLSVLCAIPGMTKSLASYLYGMGITDRSGIRESVVSLEGEVDENSMGILKEIAGGLR